MQKMFSSSIELIVFDFDGVFTDNNVWLDQAGNELVRCSRSDGLGLDLMRKFIRINKLKLKMIILSTESNPVVLARAKKLKLDCHYGVTNKYKYLCDYLSENFPNAEPEYTMKEKILYLGNDINDLRVMESSACSVCPVDAHPVIRKTSNLILPQAGGEGFVRSFVEKFIGLDNMSDSQIKNFLES